MSSAAFFLPVSTLAIMRRPWRSTKISRHATEHCLVCELLNYLGRKRMRFSLPFFPIGTSFAHTMALLLKSFRTAPCPSNSAFRFAQTSIIRLARSALTFTRLPKFWLEWPRLSAQARVALLRMLRHALHYDFQDAAKTAPLSVISSRLHPSKQLKHVYFENQAT